MNQKEVSLYLHIPFCKSKCNYCDFNSSSGMEVFIPAYIEALQEEIKGYNKKLAGYKVISIYIGGGTPSYIDEKNIYRILYNCRENFDITHDCEITIEANPGTITPEKLLCYKESGINRISIGLQSSDNRLLKILGRIHTAEDFLKSMEFISAAGIKNVNADIMFALPFQTTEDWENTLKMAADSNITHISCYSLKIEEGTPFADALERKEIYEVSDEVDREMYYLAKKILKEKGYEHYEISNFSKPGYQCRHNNVYWNLGNYIGFGAGAHSYFDRTRYNNCYDIRGYIKNISNGINVVENYEEISLNETISEYIILGLRLIKGIDITAFEKYFGKSIFTLFGKQIENFVKEKLLEIEGTFLRLTEKGLDLANVVMREFI